LRDDFVGTTRFSDVALQKADLLSIAFNRLTSFFPAAL